MIIITTFLLFYFCPYWFTYLIITTFLWSWNVDDPNTSNIWIVLHGTDEEYNKLRIFQGVILIENFTRRWMELKIFVLNNHSRTESWLMTAGHVRHISGATPRLPSATKRVHWYFGCSISVYIDFKGKWRVKLRKINKLIN